MARASCPSCVISYPFPRHMCQSQKDKKLFNCLLEYSKNWCLLNTTWTRLSWNRLLLQWWAMKEFLSIPRPCDVPPKSQILPPTGIQLTILKGHVTTISYTENSIALWANSLLLNHRTANLLTSLYTWWQILRISPLSLTLWGPSPSHTSPWWTILLKSTCVGPFDTWVSQIPLPCCSTSPQRGSCSRWSYRSSRALNGVLNLFSPDPHNFGLMKGTITALNWKIADPSNLSLTVNLRS